MTFDIKPKSLPQVCYFFFSCMECSTGFMEGHCREFDFFYKLGSHPIYCNVKHLTDHQLIRYLFI